MRENKYGVAKINTPSKKIEIGIADYVQCGFADNRLISIAKLETGSYVLTVENPATTGRTSEVMHLTEGSLVGLIATISHYMEIKNMPFEDILDSLISGDMLPFRVSDNLEVKDEQLHN